MRSQLRDALIGVTVHGARTARDLMDVDGALICGGIGEV
jgi:hypothetical protein